MSVSLNIQCWVLALYSQEHHSVDMIAEWLEQRSSKWKIVGSILKQGCAKKILCDLHSNSAFFELLLMTANLFHLQHWAVFEVIAVCINGHYNC